MPYQHLECDEGITVFVTLQKISDWLLKNKEKYNVRLLNISVGMLKSAGEKEKKELLSRKEEDYVIINIMEDDKIKDAVSHMTIRHMDTDISKIETKCRYFNELLESKEALICKALDRYNNLSDMPFALSADAIGKNCAETEVLLLPILKKAKEEFPEMADPLFILRTNIRTLNDILKLHYSEEYEKWLKVYERKE